MAKFNLVNFYILMEYDYICNCHLNLNNFQLFVISSISGKCYGFSNSNMTCCYETGHNFIHVQGPSFIKACFAQILIVECAYA